jgi:CheY-like chemotaxis protein
MMLHLSPTPTAQGSELGTDRRHILLVDDDRDIRETMQELLEQEGYKVETARNGMEALALVRRAHPALILLDLFMPVMDGLEFRRLQREDPQLHGIPVVVVSAAAGMEARVSELGVAGFLEKPLRIEQLFEIVTRYCG